MDAPLSLVVLAAGNGTRYGALKQIELFGPDKFTISEYNVLEAISCGIDEVVFIVKEQVADIFHKRLSAILPANCKFSLVYQSSDPILDKFSNRAKPWGTGHAVLSAKYCVRGNFAVMNADDLYGANAIKALVNSIKTLDKAGNTFSAIGYHLANTLSEHGPVSRGIMTVTDNQLIRISEHNRIRRLNENIVDETGNILPKDTPTSMNLWGFTPQIFKILETEWQKFKSNISDPVNDEFYLPHAVNNAISEGRCKVNVLLTTDKWHGITYHEDRKTLDFWLENQKKDKKIKKT
ncbi:MAG: hypothetical protein K2L13_03105 [Opitutales bacterium]|nr:hypothetical protein [Opitutales bacterium]